MITVNHLDQKSLAVLAQAVGGRGQDGLASIFAGVVARGLYGIADSQGRTASDILVDLEPEARGAALERLFRADPSLCVACARVWLGYLVAGNYYYGAGGYDHDGLSAVAEVCCTNGLDVAVVSAPVPLPVPADEVAEAEVKVPNLAKLEDLAYQESYRFQRRA
jgi:hypothetical protein